MNKLLRFALILLAAAPIQAQLAVTHTADGIVVRSGQGSTWSATIDLKQGGAITHLRLPESGPDLVQPESSFFNFFAMTVDGPEKHVVKAWSRGNGAVTESSVRRQGDSIVVALKGQASTWQKETYFDYAHTYTFHPDRIVLDGEANWHSRNNLTDTSMGFDVNADIFLHPVRMLSGNKPPVALEIASSDGDYFPQGSRYPIDIEFRLRNGHAFVLRADEVPEVYRSNPSFVYENPWQAGFAGRWFWEGDAVCETRDGRRPAQYVDGQLLRYRYELLLEPQPPTNHPPVATITAPVRDSRYYHVGDNVTFTGRAVDKEDGPIPAGRLQWEVWSTERGKKVVQRGSGESITFTVPPGTPQNEDYCQFVVQFSAKDSAAPMASTIPSSVLRRRILRAPSFRN